MFLKTEHLEIIDMAEDVAKMVINSEIAENYRHCLHKLKTDKNTQEKIGKFIEWKERYEEVQRFGRYHPDYQKVMKAVRTAKREMDLDEHVAAFKRAENELQMVLDEISLLIGKAVSERVKVSTGSPFFETKHSVGCSSGGSCGCSA